MNKRFTLRSAAGVYWLIDLEQEPPGYKKPLTMSKTGMEIIEQMEEGRSNEEIAEVLGNRYNSKPEDILKDIVGFEMQLRDFGYKL